jgi:hypothetical protein
LTLFAFRAQSLILFLDCLQNLTNLFELTIHRQFASFIVEHNELHTLLHQILVANNNRLKSIIFDNYSVAFPIEITNNDIVFPNIEKLYINLKTTNDLHRLLTILPRLSCLHINIDEDSFEFHNQSPYTMVPSLKQFHLQSYGPSWSLDDLATLINRIPNVAELSIAIQSSDDIRLMDGEKFFSLFSTLSLKKFNYFLQFNNSSSIDHTKILSTWQQFTQDFVCIKSDDKKTLALYTIPFGFPYLTLSNSLAKHNVFIEDYAPQVKDLTLSHVPTRIDDIFLSLKSVTRYVLSI